MTTRIPAPAAAPARAGRPPNQPAPPRRRRAWLLAVTLAVVLPAVVVLLGLKTEFGTRVLWKGATGAMAGKLSGDIVSGTLADGLTVKNLRYHDALHTIQLDRVSGAWHFSLAPTTLVISSLQIGQADLHLLPSPPAPLTLPKQIKLPLAIDLKSLRIRKILVHQDVSTAEYRDIRANAATDRLHHQVRLEHATTPFGELQAGVQLGGTAPFPLDGTVHLDSVFDQQRYGINAALTGSLQALAVKLRASGGTLDGSADIAATPFDAVPFKSARIAVAHLDPKVFAPAAPHADLSVQATLSPVAGSIRAADLSAIAVTGPISIINAAAGPADKDRLPVVSAQAQALLTAKRQALSQLIIRLPGNATVTGTAALHDTTQGELALQVADLDVQALYTTLAPTRLAGPLRVTLDHGTQTVAAQLASKALSITANAHLDPQRIILTSASMQAGASQIHLTGSLGRGPQAPFAVKGALKDFDPAVVLAQVRPPAAAPATRSGRAGSPFVAKNGSPPAPARMPPKTAGTAVHARINMDFDANGALKPTLGVALHFAVHDSVYNNLPMTGGGALNLAGQRLRASDATLSVAGNDVAISGSFGAPSDQLVFRVNAPALDRLGFGIAGVVQADGKLAGTLLHPVVEARYSARGLALGKNRLARLAGEAHIDGVPGQNPNARLIVTANAQGVHGGPADLETLSARINGTYAAHTIDLNAAGRLGGQPLALSLAAQGNLKEQGQSYAWDGVLKTLENRGVPRVSIGAPLTVSAAPGQIALGSTRLSVGPAQIDLKGLQYRPGLIQSQGAVDALRVADLLDLQQKISGVPPPVKTTLVVDGAWDFSLSDTARGFVQLKRRSGDVIAATPNGATALGLNVLTLRGDFRGGKLQLDSRIEATRLGTLAARGTVGLVRPEKQLTIGPDSTLSGSLDAALPSLRTLGALAGPSVALDGSIAAHLGIAGTLGKPALSGTLNGDKLALTLFDQGVKLRDGTAHIALDNNYVDLREVVFHGGSGTLTATGRIPLDQANTSLAATVTAERLELLGDPAKQLTLSGKATIANLNQRLQVNGRFVVDRALFNVPDKTAPKLGDDVVIVHRGALPKRVAAKPGADAAPAPAATGLLPPEMKITVDLGNNFRFKGAGADLMLAGAIAIRSGPNLGPQASGTVRVASGKFEAFGANLGIERGLITFLGPLANPSINILAMRRNQDVPAGVQVTGTVEQPRVVLVSEPNLAEEEKLSWLVFGHASTGSTASTGQAHSAVQSAALGLLNKAGGDPIAKKIGLDQLSIGASSYGTNTGQVVNLGKEISDRLNIAYEQGLAGAASVVKLTYVLTQHWSLVARGGAVAGLDVLYSRRFDRLGGGAEATRPR